MDEGIKRAILNEMYRIHQNYISGLNLACEKKCADCCTTNVTMTTVEASNILHRLEAKHTSALKAKLEEGSKAGRFQPSVTVNGMADRCAAGEELPDEQLDPNAGACPLLEDDQCSIYEYRPFECRAFVSQQQCKENGQADMSPLTVNVNNLFRQYIEHIDADGSSGNLTDVLLNLLGEAPVELIGNRPISVLMIDPEHKVQLDGIMEQLNTIRV